MGLGTSYFSNDKCHDKSNLGEKGLEGPVHCNKEGKVAGALSIWSIASAVKEQRVMDTGTQITFSYSV